MCVLVGANRRPGVEPQDFRVQSRTQQNRAEAEEGMNAERIAARRADIDAKQEQIARLLEELGCEGALLLVPQHVAWFTTGLTCQGLIAETERPAIFTNGRQRWLVASNVDSQRFFDEDLDQLGFQLKEWCWDHGRADLLHSIVAGRAMACDRPVSNMVILNEKLRGLMKTASAFERAELQALGRLVVHAVEATARSIQRGDREEEAAGQMGHRLLHHGAEPVALSVTADDRGRRYRRAGFTSQAIHRHCRLQATGFRQGLYVTASRTVSFGAVDPNSDRNMTRGCGSPRPSWPCPARERPFRLPWLRKHACWRERNWNLSRD